MTELQEMVKETKETLTQTVEEQAKVLTETVTAAAEQMTQVAAEQLEATTQVATEKWPTHRADQPNSHRHAGPAAPGTVGPMLVR